MLEIVLYLLLSRHDALQTVCTLVKMFNEIIDGNVNVMAYT